MNKSKTLLAIIKLISIAISLSTILTASVLIEGLQAIVKFGVWAIDKLNEQQELIAIGASEEVAIALIEAKLPEFRLPSKPYQWMINLLPKDYLKVKHLRDWAKERRVKGYSKMLKSELVRVLSY